MTWKDEMIETATALEEHAPFLRVFSEIVVAEACERAAAVLRRLAEDAGANETALYPADHWPCGDCRLGMCQRVDDVVAKYREAVAKGGQG